MKKEEIDNVVKLVQDAINTHEVIREYAAQIKADRRLRTISNDVIIKSLSLMLKGEKPN